MKIIFYGYSGVHSAVVAGAAYLGKLSAQKAASLQFSEIPFFGCQENKNQLRYLGEDTLGNQIYSLGVQGEMDLIPKSINNFLELFHISSHDLVLINIDTSLSTLTKWGERIARRGLTLLGNFLVCQGLKKDLPVLMNHVHLKLGDG